MPCCKAEIYGWCKDLPVVIYKDGESKEYCFFHAPQGKKGVSVEEFNRRVFERINEARAKNQICDLSGSIFEGSIDFSRATFSGETNFRETIFGEAVNFLEAKFNGAIDFSFAKINGVANFSKAEFNSEVNFFGATFNDVAKFFKAILSSKTDFSVATFSRGADFSWATFKRADFEATKFIEGTSFIKAIFNEKANFSWATFSEAYFFGETFIEGGDFIGLKIEEKVTFQKANLEKVSFLDTDLRKIDFNCDWPKKGGRNVLYDEIELFKKEKGKDFKDKIKKVEILYRQLKQKYKEEYNEPEVSNWHYGEKEMQRKQSSMKDFSFYLLHPYWLSSGYGEKPARAGIFLIFLLLYTSLFLAVAGLVVPDNVKDVHGITSIGWPYDIDIKKIWALFLNTFKYVTFQRDPFFEPANWCGEAIKLLAQILIPLQAALFALAVRNRVRR